MKRLNAELFERKTRPVRAIQFGEGNFLRAFVDYMIDIANEKEITDIGVAVVKPIPMGSLEAFEAQDNLYTVCLRGRHEGEVVDSSRVISCIEKTVDPYADNADYMELATLDTVEFVFSNTTEAGIAFDKENKFDDKPASSFPGKLTQLLFKRFEHFDGAADKGLILIPCELIERNGDTLRDCVLQYADLWDLGADFKAWVTEHNIFCNTLVDRIVTGYPGAEADSFFETLGYEDTLLSTAEPFGLWVIESKKDISQRFPLDKAGEPVVFTDDETPYRDRKVRILNGGHTTMVLAAYLAGEDIVRNCMEDKTIRGFLERTLNDEIIPTLTLPKDELEEFSASVIERFENPFIDHALLDISLNSVSKWKARVLPSFQDYVANEKEIPACIAFSLAALIAFYNSTALEGDKLIGDRNGEAYNIIDSLPVLEFFAENSELAADQLADKVLANQDFWGEDLTEYDGFAEAVSSSLNAIRTKGAKQAMEDLLA